ncbi:metallo-beta-lactamase family protein [Myxococcus stipitatus DSM 14675]|uniref:Ribonuclease J n=1 Tax=Myxococcus stipitatus (strain DSM 14675 / JCM 12634 / Mx s8) TaxID=1278073 RepID=L7U4S4_MYXSD|nr:ribonuclease J [Myxococcus stipitatus]AGC42845.1 metallo-beta-lactamase family protein [Myxococcus stipitatus DSM 14675]
MLQVIPLGGLGEIGLNSLVIACNGEMLLIDAGLMFPSDGMPGVDIIIPDFTHLKQNAAQLKGVLLTHGHEDHLGALPYLLSELSVPIPVYGTRFTLAMARHRLDELGVEADLREIEPREPFPVGSMFKVEASRVTHTVPDAVGFIVRTPEGTLIHTGDFKLDPDPIDGLRTDLERWGEAGDEGVVCLLSDSTNSELTEETGSERVVEQTFERLFRDATGRIVVALFSSNLHRVRHLLALAERLGRKVALQGRSMLRNVEMARQLGYLDVPDSLFVPLDTVPILPAQRVLVLTTGAQGEPRAGLSQLASGDGPLKVGPGDLVVLSSRPIPGNERGVGALIDQLHWRGARVAYAQIEPGVHVSGHASRPQQKRVLELVRPRHFIPVHGEGRHLHRHLATAREAGLEPAQCLLAQDGDIVGFEEGRGRFTGSVTSGRIFKDRFGGGMVTSDTLHERVRLSETGLVAAVVVIQRDTLKLVGGPQLSGQGLSVDEQVLLPRVAQEARTLFEELSVQLRGDDALVREELTRVVRRAFRLYTSKRPLVVPMVVRV